MRKLHIDFNDGAQVTYKMHDCADPMEYFRRHSNSNMKLAYIQKYPLKNNPPVYLVGTATEIAKHKLRHNLVVTLPLGGGVNIAHEIADIKANVEGVANSEQCKSPAE